MNISCKTLFSLAFCATAVNAQAVSIWNSYESPSIGSVETIYSYKEANITDGVEFALFPPNPPGKPEGGFYDFDITPDSMDPTKGIITMTLRQNVGASNLVFGPGEYDRYYLVMEDMIESAVATSVASYNLGVSVPKYEKRVLVDFFQTGLVFPEVLDSHVIVLEVMANSNLTTVDQVLTIEYTIDNMDDMDSMDGPKYEMDGDHDFDGDMGDRNFGDKELTVGIWNTFQSYKMTGILETVYFYLETMVSDEVEFPLFPPNPPGAPEGGFYDINITPDSMDKKKGTITWTSKQNDGASSLIYAPGDFDRYYVYMPNATFASATLTQAPEIVSTITIPNYEAKSLADFFQSGLIFPEAIDGHYLVMEIIGGSNLTTLGQVITVDYELDMKKKFMGESGDKDHDYDGDYDHDSDSGDMDKDMDGMMEESGAGFMSSISAFAISFFGIAAALF